MLYCDSYLFFFFFFFNDTATTEIYTLSLHDALPILDQRSNLYSLGALYYFVLTGKAVHVGSVEDRKSTRLNSSHSQISYAVFCLKKKKKKNNKKAQYENRKTLTTNSMNICTITYDHR